MSIFPEGREVVSFFLVASVSTTLLGTQQALNQCLLSDMTDSKDSEMIFSCWYYWLCLSYNEKGNFKKFHEYPRSISGREKHISDDFSDVLRVTFPRHYPISQQSPVNFMVTELSTYRGCKQCNESQRCVYAGDSYRRAASCKLPRLVTLSHEYGYKHLVVSSNIANSPRQKNHFFGLGENSLPFPLLLALHQFPQILCSSMSLRI